MKKDKWISANEMMPNPSDMKNVTVLIYRKSAMVRNSGIIEVARWNGCDWIVHGKEVAMVTHWMPLPERPLTT